MPPRGVSKQLTHFLCVPLVTSAARPQLQAALQSFHADIRDNRTPENPSGIPEKAVRPYGTLHLTLGVMSLITPDRVEAALQFLRNLDLARILSEVDSIAPLAAKKERSERPLDRAPLKVTLRGLVSMHQPEKTSILYSKPVDEDGRLEAFCSLIQKSFAEADILVPDMRPLLLHATIVNTIYVAGVRDRSGHSTGHGKRKAKLTFDARDIIGRYEEFTWMDNVRLEKVAICRMGAKKVLDTHGNETGEEEYEVEAEVTLPSTASDMEFVNKS